MPASTLRNGAGGSEETIIKTLEIEISGNAGGGGLMGNYATYTDYTDSNVEWLGKIPSHWQIKRLKFPVALINEKVGAESFDLPYMGLEHIESWTGKRIEDETASSEGTAARFLPNDILFGKLRPYLAKVYLSTHVGLASTEALVLRSSIEVSPNFLQFYLLSKDLISAVDASTYGVKMPRASWNFIGNLPLMIPPLPEQQTIARFLDYKTAQIDALIAKKEALLARLAAKRNALISQAVTKGLDPSVPMKDSGVEWLGEIPAHWDVCHMKRLAQISYGVGGEIDRTLTEGTNLLSLPNVTKDGTLLIDDVPFCDLAEGEKAVALLQKGDLLFNWRNGSSEHLGKTAYFDLEGEWTHVSFLLKLRFDLNTSDSHYFQFMLYGLRMTGFFTSSKAGVNNTFNLNELANLWIVNPPMDEQHRIADYLAKQILKLDRTVGKLHIILNKLKEYRTALITNAVTGKIDVRNVPIPGPPLPFSEAD